jgi:hypothetical protein
MSLIFCISAISHVQMVVMLGRSTGDPTFLELSDWTEVNGTASRYLKESRAVQSNVKISLVTCDLFPFVWDERIQCS